MALPELSDDLYGLPLDAFTAARNELARRLRGEGRRDDAAEIAAINPSPRMSCVCSVRISKNPRYLRLEKVVRY